MFQMHGLHVLSCEVNDFVTRAACIFVGEFIGSAIYVCFSCMAHLIISSRESRDIALVLSFASALATAIEIAFFISGGLINPVLTVMAIIYSKISVLMGFVYIIAQLFGSVMGYGLVYALVPNVNSAAEQPFCIILRPSEITVARMFLLEFVGTSVLVLIVCGLWDPRNKNVSNASIKIFLAVIALSYGPCSFYPCGLNPARALAPAIWNNIWKDHWILWISPLIAAILWTYLYVNVYLYFIFKRPAVED